MTNNKTRSRELLSASSFSSLLYGGLGLALGLVGWTVAGILNPVLLSTPAQSWFSLVSMVRSGELTTALAESGEIFAIGLIAAVVVGVGYGILVTRLRLLIQSTEWLIFALQAVPIVAIAPIVLLVLGFGTGAKSFVVFFAAVFPILINTMAGAKHAPSTLLDVAHIYRSRELRIWQDVLIPHTIPYAMTGIRQGIAMAFVGTLVAEFFLNASGIGGIMMVANSRFDVAAVLALTVLTAVIAVLLMGIGRVFERHFSKWREAEPS